MEPITAVLEIIDRIVDLLRRRNLKKEEYFDEVIDPLYNGLSPIVDDLISLFSSLERDIKEGRHREEIAKNFKAKREKYLTLRISLRSKAKAIIGGSNDDAHVDFGVKVLELFYLAEVGFDQEKNNGLTPILSTPNVFVDLLGKDIPKDNVDWENNPLEVFNRNFESILLRSIEDSSSRLERRWSRLSIIHANLHQKRYK